MFMTSKEMVSGAAVIVALNQIPADMIDLAGTIALIDEHFPAVCEAVAGGKFALWVGSGISREVAPDLGKLAAALLEHLRTKLDLADKNEPFHRTLRRILHEYARLPEVDIDALPLNAPFEDWPGNVGIAESLRNRYSEMLNLRVPGQEKDYLLWDAVDVRAQYGHLTNPDIEHLAIAILVLEGAITKIASGNWDGLIEVAVERLSGRGRTGILRVVVNPEDVREDPASATLLKFHGCAVSCVTDHTAFRPFLVGAERDIIDWPNVDDPLRREVVRMATNDRALVVGLSLQDGNLKDVFSRAKKIHAWHWPVAPEAQPHVFCEDALGNPQRTVLEVIYGDDFDGNEDDILAASLLRARPRTALPALALHVIAEKLCALAARCVGKFEPGERDDLNHGIKHLRDLAAAASPADRQQLAAFLTEAIAAWTRSMTLFRKGETPPTGTESYARISPMRKTALLADETYAQTGLDEGAAALALIGRLASSGQAEVAPSEGDAARGSLLVTASYDGARRKKVLLVSTAGAAIQLAKAGALDDGDTVFIHSDEVYMSTALSSSRSPSGGRSARGGRSPAAERAPAANHVSIRQLVAQSLDLGSLEQRFLEEAAL